MVACDCDYDSSVSISFIYSTYICTRIYYLYDMCCVCSSMCSAHALFDIENNKQRTGFLLQFE